MKIKVSTKAKGLIFDLDGTLSDSLPIHIATWKKIGEKYGFTFDTKIVHELTGRPTIEFAQRIKEQYKLNVDPLEIKLEKQHMFWDIAHNVKAVEEMVSIVKNYYGKLPISVGTGSSRKSAEVQLKALNLIHYFDAIVTADDVTRHKPNPDTFLECARIMKIEPQFCQVFEDGDNGISAAQKAGMIVVDVRPYINYGGWMNS